MARRTLLVSTRKGLFTATGSGARWELSEPAFRGVPVSAAVLDPRDGALYAALDHGHFGVKLHRRQGRTWREVAVPVYPQLPAGEVETEGGGRPWPRTLKLIWCLTPDPRQPGALWCGTIPGGLFHSADRGASWQLNGGLWDQPARRQWFGGGFDTPGIHSVLVDPRDPLRVTVAISCGGVWRSDDGGASWRNTARGMRAAYMPAGREHDVEVQDPHRLAQCREAPDRLWCQHHNGIFVQDVATDWREVKAKAPSRFGFAVAAHPTRPDTAWFVPAQKDECRVPVGGKVVVLRTENGGRSLAPLRQGLPQRHAYDLVYRHGLEVASDGRTLAMGSTTGALWISSDGGERWHTIAAHLPPIHAVHWAES